MESPKYKNIFVIHGRLIFELTCFHICLILQVNGSLLFPHHLHDPPRPLEAVASVAAVLWGGEAADRQLPRALLVLSADAQQETPWILAYHRLWLSAATHRPCCSNQLRHSQRPPSGNKLSLVSFLANINVYILCFAGSLRV